MSLLHKRASELTVTKQLRLGKNAVITVENADGTSTEISPAELGSLDDDSVSKLATEAGTGITTGTGTGYQSSVNKIGGIIHTKILID